METARRLRHAFRDWLDDTALRSPARLALIVFASVIMAVTFLLQLPMATATGTRAPFVDSLFTATSAVCVTGLTVHDTALYWSSFGQTVILVAIKVGGLGIMTLASLLGLAVSRRLGLTQRMLAAEESRASGLGDVKSLLRTIVLVSAAVETAIAAALFPRFLALGQDMADAGYNSVFYAISAFNNAGFVPNAGGLSPYVDDWWIRAPIGLGVLIGSLGFPVFLNVMRRWRHPREWSLHTKLTLITGGVLLVVSTIAFGAFEWNNEDTLGGQSVSTRFLSSTFTAINMRSGGFAATDHGLAGEESWILSTVMMFIGGGSGSTAGGLRLTTFAVLFLAIVAEARGRRDMEAFGRRVGTESLRVAVSLLLVGTTVVIAGVATMLALTDYPVGEVIFETVSAFATCGLSTGITEFLPDSAKYVLTFLMFVGRTGTMTLGAALLLNRERRAIRYPSERPIIG